MTTWQTVALVLVAVVGAAAVAFAIWLRRSVMTPAEGADLLKGLGLDLIRLPGRLRRLAADPRTPRRARWLLIGLAVYVASPIDPIPDFLPVIGHLDEVVLVPLALARIKRMIPPEVWAEHFPPPPTGRAGRARQRPRPLAPPARPRYRARHDRKAPPRELGAPG